jgi:hypothetical protein
MTGASTCRRPYAQWNALSLEARYVAIDVCKHEAAGREVELIQWRCGRLHRFNR